MKKDDKFPLGINGDSMEYEAIYDYAKTIQNVEGIILEIGTRLGQGIYTAMQACTDNDDKNRFFIGIDPYGSIEYKHGEFSAPAKEGFQLQAKTHYNRNMMNAFLCSIYKYCYDNDLYYCHYAMEDTEFMKLYKDGVIVYNDYKQIIDKYAFIIFDGPHDLQSVKAETLFFKGKVSTDGILIYDDIADYDHMMIDKILLNENFIRLFMGARKAVYKKI